MWSGIKVFIIVLLVCLLCTATVSFLLVREHVPITVEVFPENFTETSEKIDNPDRGLYSIFGFLITDLEEDYSAQIERILKSEAPTNLIMIQINLSHYTHRDLTEEGLKNIRDLFSSLRAIEKNWILRFIYDWDNNTITNEPKSIDIILRHMTQLQDLLQTNQDRIFVVQGLFIGRWGEMNGTRFNSSEDLRQLTETLMQVTGESTFLSVRTGSHWRRVTGIHAFEALMAGEVPRIGLYNDGMMGSANDCGSYSSSNIHDSDPVACWSREKELDFQELLCRYVPNGGEVIINSPLNDFENAVATLKKSRVSYLNYDYDWEVIGKWEAVTVKNGVYAGLDGLSYIERHLGYRILINDAKVTYNPQREKLIIDLELKNVGFAPLYAEKDIALQIYDKDGQMIYNHLFDQDIRQLYGGDNSGDLLELHHEIRLEGWETGEYHVYLAVRDRNTGELLVLANEQSMTQHGYKIAGIRRS